MTKPTIADMILGLAPVPALTGARPVNLANIRQPIFDEGPDRPKTQRTDLRESIIDALSGASKPMTSLDIMRVIGMLPGMRVANIGTVCGKMHIEGILKRSGIHNKYTWSIADGKS